MTEANKAVVRRLVNEILNGGHLEVIDELYAPELAPAARRWIAPFRASFPDVHMEIVELIAEGDVDQELTSSGRDEIGRTTEAFARMIDYLRESAAGRRPQWPPPREWLGACPCFPLPKRKTFLPY